jgi:dihydroorotate dehydrogenase electron transfer subunit
MIDRKAGVKTGESAFRTATVSGVEEDNYRVKTLLLDADIDAKPGQFVMVWVPGVGERPFSLGGSKPLMLTVAKVGAVSEALHKLKAGDLVSFRGPHGNGFALGREKRILLVGGGYGIVPLHFLAAEAKKKKKEVTVVLAARNANELAGKKRLAELGVKIVVATDDGSEGFKGNAVEAAKSLGLNNFDAVFSCGPEKMMYHLAIACRETKVPCQLSLERYMKCGLGLCGSCALDEILVCRDGPVFEGEKALGLAEFGKEKRDATGTCLPL